MKKEILLIWAVLTCNFCFSQGDFQSKFEKGRNYMDEFQYEKAAPIFESLLKQDTTNMNIAYLLGVCYTMGPVFNSKAIYYFEKSKSKMNSENYDSKSHLERTVPIHVYYYLAVAYAQSFNFTDAIAANDRFRELIGKINGKYLRDADPAIKGMQELKSMLNEPSTDDNFGWDNDGGNGEIIDSNDPDGGNYGVQIGAYAQSIPNYIFSGTENVRAYRGPNGLVRFVVGDVPTREEAEALRDRLKSSGYKDAFLIRLNRAEFLQEVR